MWGGKIKHILIAYFLGNTCAKNYRNRTVYVKIIASEIWDVFETRCMYTVCLENVHLFIFQITLSKIN